MQRKQSESRGKTAAKECTFEGKEFLYSGEDCLETTQRATEPMRILLFAIGALTSNYSIQTESQKMTSFLDIGPSQLLHHDNEETLPSRRHPLAPSCCRLAGSSVSILDAGGGLLPRRCRRKRSRHPRAGRRKAVVAYDAPDGPLAREE